MKRLANIGRPARTLAVDLMIKPMIAQDTGEQIDVRQVRYVLQGETVRRQQAGDHQRQRRVFRSRDRNLAVELMATNDFDAIHTGPSSCCRLSPAQPFVHPYAAQYAGFAIYMPSGLVDFLARAYSLALLEVFAKLLRQTLLPLSTAGLTGLFGLLGAIAVRFRR